MTSNINVAVTDMRMHWYCCGKCILDIMSLYIHGWNIDLCGRVAWNELSNVLKKMGARKCRVVPKFGLNAFCKQS